jgi:hypothetical protein
LKTAESLLLEVLSRAESLSVVERQETLGILGAVYKQRWSVCGHKDHLEKSVFYYRSGYRMGIASDFGYTALHTAFDLDLLMQGAHALAIEDPSRHALLKLTGKNTVLLGQLGSPPIQ